MDHYSEYLLLFLVLRSRHGWLEMPHNSSEFKVNCMELSIAMDYVESIGSLPLSEELSAPELFKTGRSAPDDLSAL